MDKEFYTVTIDRPMGSAHPDYPTLVYPINYGYIDGIFAEDGEEQDAYVVGVDIAVDEFRGERIAIIHRRDDAETKWVIAPENTPFTKQQIEEMVYFQEQYFDSYVEMLNEEMWDACDRDENLLGYTIPRSMAKALPEGVYHSIVMVYVIMPDGRLLTTQRAKNKTNPLKWEVTGGSVLAGETPIEGAVRELNEETGIECDESQIRELYKCADDKRHGIYHIFLVSLKEMADIHLQFGETMDYQFLSYEEFKNLVKSDRFLPSEKGRFIEHEALMDKAIYGK